VTVEAATQGNTINGDIIFNYYNPDTARFPQAEYAARQIWDSTGLKPHDIDAAMIYENFSPVVFYQLEAYGFCGFGEAKDFIADGHTALGGTLPVNTHGGLLGEAYIHGVNNILEGSGRSAVRPRTRCRAASTCSAAPATAPSCSAAGDGRSPAGTSCLWLRGKPGLAIDLSWGISGPITGMLLAESTIRPTCRIGPTSDHRPPPRTRRPTAAGRGIGQPPYMP
jgi:hypothetical protein